MKKNEKKFMQEDVDMDKVSGGFGPKVDTEVSAGGDLKVGFSFDKNDDHSTNNIGNNAGNKNVSNLIVGGNLSL